MPAPIRIAAFRGERPGTGPRLLPEGFAQTARNCRLIDGQIVPINTATDVETLTEVLDHRAITSDGYESTWQYVLNRKFSREKLFWTEGGGWTILGGKAVHAAGTTGILSQSLDREDAMPRIKDGLQFTIEFTVSNYVAGTVTPKIGGTSGSAVNSAGDHSQSIVAGDTNKLFEMDSTSAGDFSVDDVSVTVNIGSFGANPGGVDSWIRLAWDASDNLSEYDGWTVKIVGGTGSGQEALINTYDGKTNGKFHIANVTVNVGDTAGEWTTIPDGTSVYELYAPVTANEVKSMHLFGKGPELVGVTANATTDFITFAGHNLKNDDQVTFLSTTTLPAGLTTGVEYFIINRTPNTFQVSTATGGSNVDITDTGTGTHTLRRGIWFRWGTDVDVVRSPITGDTKEMTMWTGQGVPKLGFRGYSDKDDGSFGTTGFPMQSYTLGVPEPRIDEDEDVEVGGGEGDDFFLTYQNSVDNVDLHSDLLAVGWDGSTWKNFIVIVQAGVRLGSNASGTGLTIVAGWPSSTVINFTNNGTINGGHGAGGAAASVGGTGGTGVLVNAGFGTALTTITTDFGTDDRIDTGAPHGMLVDDIVHFTNSGGALPAGLSLDTQYYIITVHGASEISVSTTKGGATVDITDDGTGTHSIHDKTCFFENAASGLIFEPGGGGGGGGTGEGCSDIGKNCSCCTASGGAGGKGEGNTARAGGSGGACCGNSGGGCSGTCTPEVGCGGTGGTGGLKEASGTTGGNGNDVLTGGGCSGVSSGAAGGGPGPAAFDGVSVITLTNNGTITGGQIN